MAKASSHHQLVCKPIQTFENNHADKVMRAGVYNASSSVKKHALLTNLVCCKCVVKCVMNGGLPIIFLDTGTQVFLLDSSFLHTNYSHVQVHSLDSTLDDCEIF